MLIPYQYADGYWQITAKNSMNRRQGGVKRNILARKHNYSREMCRCQYQTLPSLVSVYKWQQQLCYVVMYLSLQTQHSNSRCAVAPSAFSEGIAT
jgi:hypothetical protein